MLFWWLRRCWWWCLAEVCDGGVGVGGGAVFLGGLGQRWVTVESRSDGGVVQI
ncbi:hypothetical protein HanXRQr2_Chr08g0332491 [Helianthus annuus]|uniref:Uncharacterized protein n=1 Tax=Helianthus annuus TaxID=4232 RepID=A0A9K3NCL0_HELAN|nr:hypothetical protein HanXRQr2_Chr08g0332491 [Helianthus annuus]KAJ0718730.1 hypothetical protein HanLR1_Chr08g0273821 [Helianthus annuus]